MPMLPAWPAGSWPTPTASGEAYHKVVRHLLSKVPMELAQQQIMVVTATPLITSADSEPTMIVAAQTELPYVQY